MSNKSSLCMSILLVILLASAVMFGCAASRTSRSYCIHDDPQCKNSLSVGVWGTHDDYYSLSGSFITSEVCAPSMVCRCAK